MKTFTIYTLSNWRLQKETEWSSEDDLAQSHLVSMCQALKDKADARHVYVAIKESTEAEPRAYLVDDGALSEINHVPYFGALSGFRKYGTQEIAQSKIEALQEALDDAYNHIDTLESVLGKIEDATPGSSYTQTRALEQAMRQIEEAFQDAVDEAVGDYSNEITDLVQDEVQPFTKHTELLG